MSVAWMSDRHFGIEDREKRQSSGSRFCNIHGDHLEASPPHPQTQPQLSHSRVTPPIINATGRSPFSASPASTLRVTGSQNVFQTRKEYCGLIISEHFSQTFLGPQICNLATLHKCPALKRLLVCLLSLLGFFPFGASEFFLC